MQLVVIINSADFGDLLIIGRVCRALRSYECF